MFGHIFKYQILSSVRNKQAMFWRFIFPTLILATLFNLAFGSLYETTEKMQAIKVAVVTEEKNIFFDQVFNAVCEGDDPLFDVVTNDEEKAKEMLRDKDIIGIIYCAEEPHLTVASEGTRQSIIKFFLDQYNVNQKLIMDFAKNDPSKLPDLIEKMQSETSAVRTRTLSSGNSDVYIQYFYNLIAMQALFSFTSGLAVICRGQANLSEIGKRNCASPAKKWVCALAGLASEFALSFAGSILTVIYIVFILKKEMGVSIPVMLLITAVGSLTGISIGFFFGGIGNANEEKKTGILTAIVMALCFMSGLMVGTMRAVVEEDMPFFNHINPAALITDCFYSVNTYGVGTRFATDIITLSVISVVLTVGGMILIRRQKYASL